MNNYHLTANTGRANSSSKRGSHIDVLPARARARDLGADLPPVSAKEAHKVTQGHTRSRVHCDEEETLCPPKKRAHQSCRNCKVAMHAAKTQPLQSLSHAPAGGRAPPPHWRELSRAPLQSGVLGRLFHADGLP